MKHVTCLIVTLLLCTTLASAQSRQVPAPPQSNPILLIGGTIHPVSSPMIPDGWIILRGGLIESIGSGMVPDLPDTTTTIQLDGRHVYPGLVAADNRSVLWRPNRSMSPMIMTSTAHGPRRPGRSSP